MVHHGQLLLRRSLPSDICRPSLLLAGLLAPSIMLAVCGPAAGEPERPSQLPNFILCMADDQGWGDVGYYHQSPAITPNLDAMAKVGLRFDRFYAACPVCSPTRGSVLTGRHPNRFACFEWGHSLRPEEITVAEALRTAGYATGHFGKWHLGSVSADSDVSPGSSGFDEWFSSPNFFDLNPLMSRRGKVVATRGEGSKVTMDAALAFIGGCAERKQPFLAVIWFGSPHSPHHALERDRRLYPDLSKSLQHYYGEITALDREMGRLRDALRKWGIADNTLLWYTSDNGPQGPNNRNRPGSTGGLRDRKGTLYEGGIRVPAIIEWPARLPQPRVSDFPCGTIDICPTLLELAGVSRKQQVRPLDGISLVSILKQDAPRPRPLPFWARIDRGLSTPSRKVLEAMRAAAESGRPYHPRNDAAMRAERTNRVLQRIEQDGLIGHAAWIDWPYKLHRIQDRKGRLRIELYHLEKDVAESKNLAKEEPERAARMRQALEAWQQSVVRSLRGEDYKADLD